MRKQNDITIIELLQLSFIILKLCNVIQWRWIWVLSPLLISLLCAIIASGFKE